VGSIPIKDTWLSFAPPGGDDNEDGERDDD
jgi:hypothetical protein